MKEMYLPFETYTITVLLLTVLVSCDMGLSEYRMKPDLSATEISLTLEDNSEFIQINQVINYLKEVVRNHSILDSTELNQIVFKYGEIDEVQLLVARYFVHENDFKSAEEVFSDFGEEEASSDPEVIRLLAIIYANTGRPELALDFLNRSLYLDTRFSQANIQKGDVYLMTGDTMSSIHYYKRALADVVEKEVLVLQLASLYYGIGDYSHSISYFDQLPQKSLKVDHLKKIGQIYLRQPEHESLGVMVLDSLSESGEKEAGKLLANHYKFRSEWDQVFKYSHRIYEQDTSDLFALRQKAIYFDKKGYLPSSVMYYKKILEIDSLSKEASEGLSKVYGKIAYLRKIKEKRESLQLLEVPKFETNEITN